MRLLKILLSKTTIILFAILLQLAFFIGFIYSINMHVKILQVGFYVLSVICFLNIINKNSKPDTKLPWIAIVLLFPFLGIILYLFFADVRFSKKHLNRYKKLSENTFLLIKQTKDEQNEIYSNLNKYLGQSKAIENLSGYPAHCNTKVKYFDSGESFYQSLLTDLKQAEKFIFMEYFIIDQGQMWNGILEILKEKAKNGLDVRVMYDDIGCMGLLKNNYCKTLRKFNIKCVKFNKFIPTVSNVHNYRDHRKITVIDGTISYTGGINIADEYVNLKNRFGHWKDTAARLDGKATKNFTLMFLQNYSIMSNTQEDYSTFLECNYKNSDGIVQPFGSSPNFFNPNNTGESVLLNAINQAKKYVYIQTPYLICDYTLLNALTQASLRGVDVRLVLPSVPDKKIAWELSRSNFYGLIKEGVKVYLYTPGFIHSKVVLCDDDIAVVGTINFDYRSLVHHYEDAVFMYKCKCIEDIYKDFENLFKISSQQSLTTAKQNFFVKTFCALIKIFTPLM